jgi:hypothetical protein
MPHSPVEVHRRFGITCYLPLQGWRVNHTASQPERNRYIWATYSIYGSLCLLMPLAGCSLPYSWNLKMEAVCFFETSVNLIFIFAEDSPIHIHHCEYLKFNWAWIFFIIEIWRIDYLTKLHQPNNSLSKITRGWSCSLNLKRGQRKLSLLLWNYCLRINLKGLRKATETFS